MTLLASLFKIQVSLVLHFCSVRACLCVSTCVSETSHQNSKEVFHSKTMPSAAQYMYSAAGGVALPSLLRLHLPSALLCL